MEPVEISKEEAAFYYDKIKRVVAAEMAKTIILSGSDDLSPVQEILDSEGTNATCYRFTNNEIDLKPKSK